MTEDNALLRLFVHDGNEEAFTTLVRRRVDFVYATALRIVGGDAHLAQDVTQLVFIDLAKKAPQLVDRPALMGWIHTSTRFAASKIVRTERRWQRRTEEAHIMSDIEYQSKQEPSWEQLKPIIDESLAQLGENDREAILLRFFENLPLAEVGRCVGLSENAAGMRVGRAMQRLRLLLGKRGIHSTAGVLAMVLSHQPCVAAPSALASQIAAAALGAASQTSVLGTLGSLLTNSKLALAVAGTTACLTLGIALLDHDKAARLDEENRALMAENDRLRLEYSSAAKANDSLAQDTSALKTKVGNLITTLAEKSMGEKERARLRGQRMVERYPDFLVRLKEYQQQGIHRENRAFYAAQKLSPFQIAALESFEIGKSSSMVGMTNPKGNFYIFQLGNITYAPGEEQAHLAAILGAEGARQYNEYQRSSILRTEMTSIIGTANCSENTADHIPTNLVEVIANCSPNYSKGGYCLTTDIDWDLVRKRTEGLLSESQLAQIQSLPLAYSADYSRNREIIGWVNRQAKKGAEIPQQR